MSNKIFLHGALGEEYGKEHKFKVSNFTQVTGYLIGTNRAIREDILNGHFKVIVGDVVIGELELNLPILDGEDIHIVPVIEGDKSTGATILTGAALIGLAFIPGGAAATSIGLGGLSITSGVLGTIALNVGVGLVLSGVSQMLAPTPNQLSSSDTRDVFTGTQNVTSQGGAIPVVYGRTRVGSTVISTGVTNEEPGLF